MLGSNKPASATEFMHVWGDFDTRLKTVYTGDNRSQTGDQWYRIL
jgi:hypothetical protein